MASQPSTTEAPKPLDPQLGIATITPPPTIPDPSTLILRMLTPAEKEASWITNSVSWAGRLTQADYVAREATNAASNLLRDGGVRFWGLTTEGEGGEIYSAVETLKKRVLVQTSKGFDVEDAYGIASVFTPAKYRGHGLAGTMMRKLGEWLDTEEANCRFSVLFSDVGDFYTRHGWAVVPSPEVTLPASPLPTSTSASPPTTTITADSLHSFAQSDLLTLSAEAMAPPTPGKHTRLAFVPSVAQAEWHFGAEEISAAKLYPDQAPPTAKGASVGATFGYWVRDFNERKLIMLRLREGGPWDDGEAQGVQEVVSVLRAAQAEAHEWGLGKVVVWNPDEKVKEACRIILGKEVEVRNRTEGSVPCLRWNGKEGGGKGEVEARVEWLALEKYCWC
ncbi:hypothetical protein V496_08555 [Pseudogymnoascus sp. VKM F-4515 (FW-2607)]|nr:hypothetical protein V496_08555 [Pseudogymnoascus sp. VKM F-4515 (FW-2607)]KFY95074.1 hypothetical protein V498_03546 [Pseudogymnoascus sp. VKM F-4517 (FW-2822)]